MTKGSAYHHFADRQALLRGALELWERRQVEELNAAWDQIPDPRDRLRRILVYSLLEKPPTVILQFMAARDDPDVAAALTRAAEDRLAMLRRVFAALGATKRQAEDRAVLAYSNYLGLAQLRAQLPDVLPTAARVRAHVDALERVLLAG